MSEEIDKAQISNEIRGLLHKQEMAKALGTLGIIVALFGYGAAFLFAPDIFENETELVNCLQCIMPFSTVATIFFIAGYADNISDKAEERIAFLRSIFPKDKRLEYSNWLNLTDPDDD